MPLISDITGIIFGTDNIQVIGLENVDLWYAEEHEINVSVTKYPVEDGSSISDNAYRKPYKIKLSGMITNIQELTVDIPFLFGAAGIVTTQKPKTGWALLDKFANERGTFTIMTTVKTYENMLITGVKTRIDYETGTNLIFDLSFQEVKLVETDQDTFSPINVQGSSNPAGNSTDIVNGGTKNTTTVNAPTSLLNSFLGG